MARLAKVFAASAALFLGTAGMAFADDCSGHSHDTGTAVGAVGGAAIGGLASHSIGGAIIGGVVGGFAGNAIDRAQDCQRQQAYDDRTSNRQAYEDGRAQQAYDDNRAAADDQRRAYYDGRNEQAAADADRRYPDARYPDAD